MDLIFHDGLQEPIDVERMTEFDVASILDQLYDTRSDIDSSHVLEELGSWALDYTNLYDWSGNTPDIQSKGARLFQIWAEDKNSGEVVGVIRGHFALIPFTFSISTMRDYYTQNGSLPYYPMAIITSLRTTFKENDQLDELLENMFKQISFMWQAERMDAIHTIEKGSDMWKRFVSSFDEIIHFTVACPSIHRRLIDALKRRNYRITGVTQLLASPAPSYDKATIEHHIKNAEKLLDSASSKKH